MKLNVQFLDEHDYVQEEMLDSLSSLLQTAAEMEEIEAGEISVTFVNNEEIQELNRTYRDKNQPTDVLSFPMYEADQVDLEVDDEKEPPMFGDIIISIPKARSQATEYGHSFERELGFLLVHGFLHLLGFDHEDRQDEQAMFTQQEEVLAKHGLIR